MNYDETRAHIQDALQSVQLALNASLNQITGEIIQGQEMTEATHELKDCIRSLNLAIAFMQRADHSLHLRQESGHDMATTRSARCSAGF